MTNAILFSPDYHRLKIVGCLQRSLSHVKPMPRAQQSRRVLMPRPLAAKSSSDRKFAVEVPVRFRGVWGDLLVIFPTNDSSFFDSKKKLVPPN